MSAAERPDVEIAADAAARELRFRGEPQVETHADETVSARKRLPRPVRAGVTYRGVRAAMRAMGRFTAGR
jgi:hypothetical protein